jgi:hypothetical protein
MDFQQLDGQETFLAERRCCEAAGLNQRSIPTTPGVFSHIVRLPETSQADAQSVTFGGNIPRGSEYRLLLETPDASRRTGTALCYPEGGGNSYGCADYPELSHPQEGLDRPQHRERIS